MAELAKATGHSPREVLERLIDFELLAAEARRRGLDDSPEVREQARKAMVQRYLQDEFEAHHRVEDVPEPLLRHAYQRFKGHYVHPKLYRVAHILVWAPEKESSPAKRREAHRLAQRIAREAHEVKSLNEFYQLGQRYQGAEGFKVQASEVNGAVHAHSSHHEVFRKAVLALDRPGQVAGPVDTIFGSHVIYLIDTREPSNRSFDEARREIAEGIHPMWLKQEFIRFTDSLRMKIKVTGYVGEKRRIGDR